MSKRNHRDPTPQPRETVHTLPAPPQPLPTIICTRCGGHYIDLPIGRDAHKTVFGHSPTQTREGD